MPFEVFDKGMTPLAKAPSVTVQKRGVISLNKAAHDLVGNAKTVKLLYNCDRQVMALRATDDFSPHAYAVRSGSQRGSGQAIVSATAFTPPTTASIPPPPPMQAVHGGWDAPCGPHDRRHRDHRQPH